MMKTFRGAIAVLALATASACGSDDAARTAPDSTPGSGASGTAAGDDTTATTRAESGTPSMDVAAGENMLTPAPGDDEVCTTERAGGSATFGLVRPTSALDPTKALGSGVAGGIEIAAIYDTLVLYDPQTGEYRPHIAEFVSANDDLTEWTVRLRDDVMFGNGEPLTAEAVKFSFERMREATVSSAGLVAGITDIEIVDDQTLVFTLEDSSGTFLYVLAEDAGNITNPTVVESMSEDEFNLSPVGAGAGPYEVESFTPGESLVLAARDNYWGGPVCIETLTFINVPGAEGSYESFELGELDMTYIRSAPIQAQAARDAGYEVLGSVTNGETVLILNVGREGTSSPLQDVRLRQAVAAAIDVELIDERVNEGLGIPGSALVADREPWSPGVPGPQYDPERASQLVEEVKADGWDGGPLSIVVGDSPPQLVETAILVEGMLEAVGIDVEVESMPPVEVNTRVIDEASFDMAFFGISALEDAPTARYTSYQTGSPRNRTGYGSPEMDAALAELNQALTRAQKREAMATIQEVWNRDVPSVIVGHGEWLVALQPSVHGVHISRDVVPMFFDAYMDQ